MFDRSFEDQRNYSVHASQPRGTRGSKPYSTSCRNRNRAKRNHLDQSLLSSQKNRKSLTWVLVALTVCFTYPVLYSVSAESRASEWELLVIDNKKSWSLRADARRRITAPVIRCPGGLLIPSPSALALCSTILLFLSFTLSLRYSSLLSCNK